MRSKKASISFAIAIVAVMLAVGGYLSYFDGGPDSESLEQAVLDYQQIRLKNEVENMLTNHDRKMVQDYYSRIGYGSFPDHKQMQVKRFELIRMRPDDRGGYVAFVALETRVDNFVMNESGKYTLIPFQEKWTVIGYRPDATIRFSP